MDDKLEEEKKQGIEAVVKTTMEKDPAKKAYEEYSQLLKERETEKKKEYEELKKAYYHLSKGRKVIDIIDCMKKGGVNEQGEPRLAIAKANARRVIFEKMTAGSGSFYDEKKDKWRNESISVPSDTFEDWETDKEQSWRILRSRLLTGVPIIPANLLPNGKLENYYILWEVKDWDDVAPAPDDPYLLKRISPNLFVVLAEWEVTELESIIVRGNR